MPCGKRPLVQRWDRPKEIKTVKPSRYQQNEASVKVHWKNVIRALELFYKDEKFWESQTQTVRDLVGPVIFERLAKIFDLPTLEEPYEPMSEISSIMASEHFYVAQAQHSRSAPVPRASLLDSISDYGDDMEEEGLAEEGSSDEWSIISSSHDTTASREFKRTARSKSSVFKSKSAIRSSKSINMSSSRMTPKIMSKMFNRSFQKSFSSKFVDKLSKSSLSEDLAYSDDDVIVHPTSRNNRTLRFKNGEIYNPHFELLYCSTSETDMIKWESKFKKKTLEVSASDEYSKKAELLTKQIANEFYDWWISVGSADYKSEIKCPGDLESLFQIWFDEHASRGLVLDPKIMPCVLQTIANYVGVPHASCPRALKRQIAWDIHAETSPAHTRAFNSSLPLKAKHIPPQNKTAENWRAVQIPEDLKTMTAIWGDISHLTSTKAFTTWLQKRPYLPMPPCLKELGQPGDKKQLFVVPSDFVFRGRSESLISTHDLNIPVSEFSLEIKDVLSRLLRD